MSEGIWLHGAEDVRRAGSAIGSAADQISRSASYFEEALRNHATRMEEALRQHSQDMASIMARMERFAHDQNEGSNT